MRPEENLARLLGNVDGDGAIYKDRDRRETEELAIGQRKSDEQFPHGTKRFSKLDFVHRCRLCAGRNAAPVTGRLV
jgi:hypothetical protein